MVRGRDQWSGGVHDGGRMTRGMSRPEGGVASVVCQAWSERCGQGKGCGQGVCRGKGCGQGKGWGTHVRVRGVSCICLPGPLAPLCPAVKGVGGGGGGGGGRGGK